MDPWKQVQRFPAFLSRSTRNTTGKAACRMSILRRADFYWFGLSYAPDRFCGNSFPWQSPGNCPLWEKTGGMKGKRKEDDPGGICMHFFSETVSGAENIQIGIWNEPELLFPGLCKKENGHFKNTALDESAGARHERSFQPASCREDRRQSISSTLANFPISCSFLASPGSWKR